MPQIGFDIEATRSIRFSKDQHAVCLVKVKAALSLMVERALRKI